MGTSTISDLLDRSPGSRDRVIDRLTQGSFDVLRSATSVNAEIVQRAGELGVLRPGAAADLLVLETNPLDDLSVFERFRTDLVLTMKDGEVVKDLLS